MNPIVSDIEKILKEKSDKSQELDQKRKGGGRRKRRTAYRSGRREKLGLRNGKIQTVFKQLKKKLRDYKSKDKKRDNKKRSHDRTPASSKQRWKKR